MLQKPVTPAQLLAAIDDILEEERLPAAMPRRIGAARPMPARSLDVRPVERIGNVIPLFGEGRKPAR